MKKAIQWGLVYLIVLTLLTACGGSGQKADSDSAALDYSASGGKTTEKTTKKAKPKEMEWKLEEGVLTISGSGPMEDYDFNAAPWGNQMNVLVIEEGITHIGNNAFERCSNLNSVTLPESLESIGSKAFYNCRALNRIQIPDNCSWIGDYAFGEIDDLTIMLPSGCFGLGKDVFKGRSKVVNNSLVLNHIESSLYNCDNLESVTLTEGLISIPDDAFRGCTPLTEITFPEGLTSIGEFAFQGCTSLTEVAFPESLTSIGKYAFNECTSLTEVALPESLTSIGEHAFYKCTSLTEVTLSEGLTSFGDYAFSDCTSLTKVTFPEGLTSIGGSAFRECTSLTEITLPEGLTSIGSCAFDSCALKEIVFPKSLTSIEGGKCLSSGPLLEKVVFTGDCSCEILFVQSQRFPEEFVFVFPQTHESREEKLYFRGGEYVILPRNSEYVEANIHGGITNTVTLWVPKALKELYINYTYGSERDSMAKYFYIQYEGDQDEWESIEKYRYDSFANIEFNVPRPEY